MMMLHAYRGRMPTVYTGRYAPIVSAEAPDLRPNPGLQKSESATHRPTELSNENVLSTTEALQTRAAYDDRLGVAFRHRKPF